MDEAHAAAASGVSFRVALACDLTEVRPATLAVRAFLEDQKLPEGEISACELALVEACNNAVQYADSDAQLEPVEITVVYSPSKVEVRVIDHTQGFDWPQKSELPPLENERGRGIYFIQALMDQSDYVRGKNENCLVMHKLLSAPASQEETTAPPAEASTEQPEQPDLLAAILRCSSNFGKSHDLSAFASEVAREIVRLMAADWAVLRTIPPSESRLVTLSSAPREVNLEASKLPRPGLGASTLETRAASEHRDVAFGPKHPLTSDDPLAEMGPDSQGLVHPFRFGDAILGTIAVGRKAAPFDSAQAELLHTFGDFLAIQIVNHQLVQEEVEHRLINRELEIAEAIQRSLLPRSLPEIPDFSLAGYCKCARPIGGDFYDVVRLPDGSLLLVIADVMGNGVPSALFAAELHSLARAMPEWVCKPSELLRRINRLMFEELSAVDMFITAQLAFFDPARLQLRIGNAGHCPALLINPGEPIRQITPEGMPIGWVRDVEFRDETVDLTAQSRLLLFTDGVTDTENIDGERFGLDRLLGWLSGLPQRPATAEHEKFQLASELVRFQGAAPLSDDQTFLLLCGDAHAPFSPSGERDGVRGPTGTNGVVL